MYHIRGVNQDGRNIINLMFISEGEAKLEMDNWLYGMTVSDMFFREGYTIYNKNRNLWVSLFIVDTEGMNENSN